MKMIPFTSMAALLLLAGAGCTLVRSSGNDEAKVVARILARTAPTTLVFKDQPGAQQLVSSLDTSEYFDFGVILDSQRQVFASYFRPDQISKKEKLLARVTQPPTSDRSEAVIVDQGLAIAIVPMKINQQIVGYVAVGRKRS
jgi:sensor histidine kinase regulating citrate/malate metabolism